MKIWLLRVGVWLTLKLRVYYVWSRVYQWLYEKRKWSQVTIPLFPTFKDIEEIVGAMEWHKDSWRELWDAISSPQAAYGKHLKGERTSHDCLPAGTLLLRNDYSFVPIEHVKIGDTVIGNGSSVRILKTWRKGIKPTLVFRLNNGCSLTCTADHKIFVHRGIRGGVGRTKKVQCIRAKEVHVGDILLQPQKFPLQAESPRDTKLAWLEGTYVADGWVSRYNQFYVAALENGTKHSNRERIQKFCTARGIYFKPTRKCVAIGDKILTAHMRTFGIGAPQKHVPNMAFDKKSLNSFLLGVQNDASTAASGTITYNTTSVQLALQLRVLHRMRGESTHLRRRDNHGGLGDKPIYRIIPRTGIRGRFKSTTVREIAIGPEVETYDVMTESGEIYLPECDIVVHNCDDISIFAAFCLERARKNGNLTRTVTDVGLLSCPWLKNTGKVGGHNVCAFAYRNNGGVKWASISNWYDGEIQWDFSDKEDIIKKMTAGFATSLGWAYARVSLKKEKLRLKPTEYHWNVKGD
ncbi:MAG: hypothetical protein DRP01_02040 [Archaeoglobales archaeon]|nr:MAG: hypothetical protein DRP01_02040 [Archaeoglobales archaeon]